MDPNLVVLSHPTYAVGTTIIGSATYIFFTKGYKPPSQPRAITSDVVINQNGKFKYVYDNGPGFRQWSPFSVICEDKLAKITGLGATAQFAAIQSIWENPGKFGMQAPDGTYDVNWAESAQELAFRVFPKESGDIIEYEVIIQVEES